MRRAALEPRREGGFTLVEITLTLLISVIVLAGMYRAFNTMQKWWLSSGVASDQRQSAGAGLDTVVRDLEMAGYLTTNYGDIHKKGVAITFASAHEIEMDQQRPDSSTIGSANPVYEPRLVYYHLATDVRTERQNLYRQIREQPGLASPDEIVAENVSAFRLEYFDHDNLPVAGLPPANAAGSAAYTPGVAVPSSSPLRAIRRIDVTLTTIPAGATTLAAASPAGSSSIAVASTAGFPPAGKLVVFRYAENAEGDRVVVDQETVTYTGIQGNYFTGLAAFPGGAAGNVVAPPMRIGIVPKPLTLKASVTPQNLGATEEATADVTPPAVPTAPKVIDKRDCINKLRVRWTPNTEPDLAGYVLFYGPTGSFVVPLRAVDKNDPRVTLNPHDLLITKNADRATAPNSYPIQVAAYDSSGNYSGKSAATSGNPSPDVTDFDTVPFLNDSAVNPLKPTPPNTDSFGQRTPLAVTAGANVGEMVVSWQAPADDSATAGYRLYRSTAAFADGHIDDSLQVRDEAILTAEVTTWTDRGLVDGVTYHYAVASVNCDETLVATYQHDSANPELSDYVVASGVLPDTTFLTWGEGGEPRCTAPTLACQGQAQLANITLTNPLEAPCADFDRTEIFWSKPPAIPPYLDGTVVGGGSLLPDSDGGSAGSFTKRGSQVIVFDSETEAAPLAPSLVPGETYNLLAVSYDRSGNASPPASTACTVLGPSECTDDPPGPPPASFASPPTNTSCWPESAVLGWEYPGRDSVADLAGFRVERAGPGGTVELTAGPTSLKSWTDAGPLEAGAEYTYTVTATDCVWEQYLLNVLPLPYVNPLTTLTIGPVFPGGLRRYVPPEGGDELAAANFVTTQSDVPASYTYHNYVKFFLQNTSRSPMTIKQMKLAWDNPNVVLASIVIGGPPSGTTERTVNAGGAASGTAFAVNAAIADVAGSTSSPSGPVPVLLRFTTPGGSVNHLTDMRNQVLSLSLWVRNHSFQDSTCAVPATVAIDVPRGPVLGDFSQSAPGMYGIDSFAVVGPSGTARDTDIHVPYGIPVNVFGAAFDNSRELFADGFNRGFAALKLVGISADPADPAAIPLMPTSGAFFERPLHNTGGNRYAIHRTSPAAGALLPEVSDKVLWYYALAVDNTGNWDRVPNPDAGNYAYFQPPFDVCTVAPRAPVLTLVSATATQALLSWTAPTQYESGLAIVADDVLTYDVYVKSAGGDPWPSAPVAADLGGLSFTHSADLSAGTYYYMVRAKNSCPTGPRPSVDSNMALECEGVSGLDCSLFSVPATARYGDPITLAVSDFCAYHGNGVADSLVFRVQGAATTNFTVLETGDDGTFAKVISAVWSGGGGDQVLAPAGSLSVSLVVGGTVTCAAKTVTLTGGPCPTTPKAPVMGSVTRTSTSTNQYTLTFAAPTQNTDNTPLLDLAGYRLLFSTGSTAPTTYTASNSLDVGLITSPRTLTVNVPSLSSRYYFWMQAYDSCGTRVYSATSSPAVRANQ